MRAALLFDDLVNRLNRVIHSGIVFFFLIVKIFREKIVPGIQCHVIGGEHTLGSRGQDHADIVKVAKLRELFLKRFKVGTVHPHAVQPNQCDRRRAVAERLLNNRIHLT